MGLLKNYDVSDKTECLLTIENMPFIFSNLYKVDPFEPYIFTTKFGVQWYTLFYTTLRVTALLKSI